MKAQTFFAAAFLALSASAANASTDFAGPYCETGCRRIDEISNGGDQIYFGAVAKAYRVCRLDDYNLSVAVDGTAVAIPDRSTNHRNCLDVTGLSISVSGNSALVGPVGP